MSNQHIVSSEVETLLTSPDMLHIKVQVHGFIKNIPCDKVAIVITQDETNSKQNVNVHLYMPDKTTKNMYDVPLTALDHIMYTIYTLTQ